LIRVSRVGSSKRRRHKVDGLLNVAPSCCSSSKEEAEEEAAKSGSVVKREAFPGEKYIELRASKKPTSC
jgi:hypothetical protein